MRLRPAPIITATLASSLFLFAASSSWVFAQFRDSPTQDDRQSRNDIGCNILGIVAPGYDRDGKIYQGGEHRFFSTDKYHWEEYWVDWNANSQSSGGNINPIVYILESHDYSQASCDSNNLVIYDVSRDVSVRFQILSEDRLQWTYWNGNPHDTSDNQSRWFRVDHMLASQTLQRGTQRR
jgi:hypothetical protein